MTVSNGTIESMIPWEFDKSVAHTFQEHAFKHIPDYQKVINLSIQITLNLFGTRARVLDFGSALGYTIDQFSKAGIESVYGIEKSNDMIQGSLFQERVTLDDKIPDSMGSFDIIIANWTLHFIEYRAPIIHSFYNHLTQGGIIIITDKITSATYIHDLYIEFKRKNGLPEEEIQKKQNP